MGLFTKINVRYQRPTITPEQLESVASALADEKIKWSMPKTRNLLIIEGTKMKSLSEARQVPTRTFGSGRDANWPRASGGGETVDSEEFEEDNEDEDGTILQRRKERGRLEKPAIKSRGCRARSFKRIL